MAERLDADRLKALRERCEHRHRFFGSETVLALLDDLAALQVRAETAERERDEARAKLAAPRMPDQLDLPAEAATILRDNAAALYDVRDELEHIPEQMAPRTRREAPGTTNWLDQPLTGVLAGMTNRDVQELADRTLNLRTDPLPVHDPYDCIQRWPNMPHLWCEGCRQRAAMEAGQ